MNVGDAPPGQHLEPGTSEQHINAQAGPSTLPDIPAVFLPPPVPLRQARLIDSTQDLVARFQLLPSYDKYVRPLTHQSAVNGESHSNVVSEEAPPTTPYVATPSALDKGKGREISVGTPRTPFAAAATPAAAASGGDGDDGDEEGGKGEKKKKNGYRHLIKGIPGKHSTKRDDVLQMMMLVPPKQKISIQKFDVRTQREAFSVSLEGLKGWNINTLVTESAQAREDRKRRKELKKLAKTQPGPGGAQPSLTQLTTAFPPVSAGLSTASTTAPTPAPHSAVHRHPQTPSSMGVGTPRPPPPLMQRSGSRPPGRGPVSAEGNARPGTPASSTALPNADSMTIPQRPGSADALARRGKKREFEENSSGLSPPATAGAILVGGGQTRVTQNFVAPGSAGAVSSRGDLARPLKRPRTEGTSHSHMTLSHPQQQPTPQGV